MFSVLEFGESVKRMMKSVGWRFNNLISKKNLYILHKKWSVRDAYQVSDLLLIIYNLL